MKLTPTTIKQYHIFLASPGDVNQERQMVRDFFERHNRYVAQLWGVRFEVVDWENYSSIGLGRPQELITHQTLERFKDSLALVIGIIAQRFGSPTGVADSGTEEEFRWALEHYRQHGFPEIKWFFKRVERFIAPPQPDAIAEAAAQWGRVQRFLEEVKAVPSYVGEYPDTSGFKDFFENDLNRWLADPSRPWIANAPPRETYVTSGLIPEVFYQSLERDFYRLDIAGIDNERAFEIPLSEIYVRLRVMFDEELQNEHSHVTDAEAIDIQTALLRYPKLVIVGDPGSGKSTFLKYVALMLARSVLQNNPSLALEKLCIEEPLPLPLFVSCWDLSDFLRERGDLQLSVLLDFVVERMKRRGLQLSSSELDSLLKSGSCCLLFDGLDEVPTDAGRAMVSRLLEDCLKQFPKNRYVVTSRVRAYTGDTILKGEFARCDIQPFDANDRAQFLKNWVALLFKASFEHVLTDGTDANREFKSLTEGIEASDRIRPLAVNPLLLTVIAIVHWNRKRLPEQRVDLYDECVDVLLGQRKEAEHILVRRKGEAFDEQLEREREEERPWVRKRFAEIALRILEGEGKHEEASKSEVIKVLAPRFADRGANTPEEAEIQAARFLEKQELHSGLLVSRREHSYRFVHLTFQEYLAAWHLSNQDFENVAPVIEPRLRQQRWFETMQLLGGEWAKQSDEKLDRYLGWLLDRQGDSIMERAPIVALCANIVKDSSGVAELTSHTRRRFQSAVEDTLDAFRPRSGIPVLTQLEILEALGRLGAAVKSHLIDATKSGLNQVRSRAIQILLPHLSDDELFEMGHLLKDRSKEPIKTYLLSLLSRDPRRTVDWIHAQGELSEKATDGFTEVLGEFINKLSSDLLRQTARCVFQKGASLWGGRWASRRKLVGYLENDMLLQASIEDREAGVRQASLSELALRNVADDKAWQLILGSATKDPNEDVRIDALRLLAEKRKDDPQTWEMIRQSFLDDDALDVRTASARLLADIKNDDPQTWLLLEKSVSNDEAVQVRVACLDLLTDKQQNKPQTWRLVRFAAIGDKDESVRRRALHLLAMGHGTDPETWKTLSLLASKDEAASVRRAAFGEIMGHDSIPNEARHLFNKYPVFIKKPNYPSYRFIPYFDPQDTVDLKLVSTSGDASQNQKTFEELAERLKTNFGIELKLEWR